MKKATKKITFILAMAIICTALISALPAYGAIDDKKTQCGENCAHDHSIEIEYKDIPAEKSEMIVKSILGVPNENPGRGNIFCIFGHDKQTGTVTVTEHNYYPTTPKCRRTMSFIEYCVRSGCDYYVVTGQSVTREYCH